MSDTGPTGLVVDSSVAVKWFLSEGERDVDRAWALLESHLAEVDLLAAPDHLRLEVLNALLHRGVTAEGLQAAASALEGFRLAWYRTDARLSSRAASIAANAGLTLYDAMFAALALDLDAELVTADRRLAASGVCRLRMLGE